MLLVQMVRTPKRNITIIIIISLLEKHSERGKSENEDIKGSKKFQAREEGRERLRNEAFASANRH